MSPSTVAGWESGRDPSGETREKYAYFLKGADAKISTQDSTAQDSTASEPAPTASEPAPADPHHEEQGELTGPRHAAGARRPPRPERRPDPGPDRRRRERRTREARRRPGSGHRGPAQARHPGRDGAAGHHPQRRPLRHRGAPLDPGRPAQAVRPWRGRDLGGARHGPGPNSPRDGTR
nr:hypothetical protein [Streptomyces sp. GbtcB7]